MQSSREVTAAGQQPTSSEARPRKLQKQTNLETPRKSSQPVRTVSARLLLSGMLRYVIFVGEEARAQLLLANAKCNKSPPCTTPLECTWIVPLRNLHLYHLFVAFSSFPFRATVCVSVFSSQCISFKGKSHPRQCCL